MAHPYQRLLDTFGITPYKLEKLASLGNGVVQKAITNKRELQPGTLALLHKAFPRLSQAWIIDGTEPMLIDGGKTDDITEVMEGSGTPQITKKATGRQIAQRKAFEPSAIKGVRFAPIGAQANYARHFTDPVYEYELERFAIPGMPYDGDSFMAWQMEGDSMTYIKDGREDGIMDREYIITEIVPQEYWRSIKDYHVYAVVTDTLVTIKRLYKLSPFEYAMIPDNTDYEQERLDIEDVRQLWIFKRKLEWNAAPPRRIEITLKPRRDANGNRLDEDGNIIPEKS